MTDDKKSNAWWKLHEISDEWVHQHRENVEIGLITPDDEGKETMVITDGGQREWNKEDVWEDPPGRYVYKCWETDFGDHTEIVLVEAFYPES